MASLNPARDKAGEQVQGGCGLVGPRHRFKSFLWPITAGDIGSAGGGLCAKAKRLARAGFGLSRATGRLLNGRDS